MPSCRPSMGAEVRHTQSRCNIDNVTAMVLSFLRVFSFVQVALDIRNDGNCLHLVTVLGYHRISIKFPATARPATLLQTPSTMQGLLYAHSMPEIRTMPASTARA